MEKKPEFKRILIKLSGEALMGNEGFGIDPKVLDRMAQEIKELVELGIQVGLVIGGGNLFRGEGLAKAGMNRVVGDHMGMLAIVMNALALRMEIEKRGAKVTVLSGLDVPQVCDSFTQRKMIAARERGDILIFAGGTGNPYFTSDTAASNRCQ